MMDLAVVAYNLHAPNHLAHGEESQHLRGDNGVGGELSEVHVAY